jgi:hypothetical protein
MIEPSNFFYIVVPAWIIIGTTISYIVWKKSKTLSSLKSLIVRSLTISIIFASVPISPDHQGYNTVLIPLWAMESIFRLEPNYVGVLSYLAVFTLFIALTIYTTISLRKFISKNNREVGC